MTRGAAAPSRASGAPAPHAPDIPAVSVGARRPTSASLGRLASGGSDAHVALGSNPVLVGYVGTIDTELMAGEDGVVAKIGAEGLLSIGLPDGCGVALGLCADTHAFDAPPVMNSRGEVVGRLEVAP